MWRPRSVPQKASDVRLVRFQNNSRHALRACETQKLQCDNLWACCRPNSALHRIRRCMQTMHQDAIKHAHVRTKPHSFPNQLWHVHRHWSSQCKDIFYQIQQTPTKLWAKLTCTPPKRTTMTLQEAVHWQQLKTIFGMLCCNTCCQVMQRSRKENGIQALKPHGFVCTECTTVIMWLSQLMPLSKIHHVNNAVLQIPFFDSDKERRYGSARGYT